MPQSSDAYTEVLERAVRIIAWMALHGRANAELNEKSEQVLGKAASLRLPSQTRWGSMADAVSALLEVWGTREPNASILCRNEVVSTEDGLCPSHVGGGCGGRSGDRFGLCSRMGGAPLLRPSSSPLCVRKQLLW